MHQHIIAYLEQQSSVTKYVGDDPVKIWPHKVPAVAENKAGARIKIAPPYLTFQWAGGDSIEGFEGRTGVSECFFQVTAVAVTGKTAEDLYMAVRNKLGQRDHELWDCLFVQRSTLDMPQDVTAAPTDGSGVPLAEFAGRLFVRGHFES